MTPADALGLICLIATMRGVLAVTADAVMIEKMNGWVCDKCRWFGHKAQYPSPPSRCPQCGEKQHE